MRSLDYARDDNNKATQKVAFIMLLVGPGLFGFEAVDAGLGLGLLDDDVAARPAVLEESLVFPVAAGELEVGGQMELEVDGAGGVVDVGHLDALGFPVGQLGLIAGDIHVAFHRLALQFDMEGVGLLASELREERGGVFEIEIQSILKTGYINRLVVVAGIIFDCHDGVAGEVGLVAEEGAGPDPSLMPSFAKPGSFVTHSGKDETGLVVALKGVLLEIAGHAELIVAAVGRQGDVVVEQIVGNHTVEYERGAERVADADLAACGVVGLFDKGHQLLFQEFLQVARTAVGSFMGKVSLTDFVDRHRQEIGITPEGDFGHVGRDDADNDEFFATIVGQIGIAEFHQTVNEVEFATFLCIEHVEDVVIGGRVFVEAYGGIDQNVALEVVELGLHG